MMNHTNRLISFLDALGITVKDRRPRTGEPLPYREGFAGYKEHDFERDCRGICVHHSALSRNIGSPDSRIEGFAQTHIERWPTAGGLAYSIVIAIDGRVIVAWDLNRRLYSQGWKDDKDNPETLGDENVFWKGVLVDGNFAGPHNPGSTEEPTPEQLHALEAIRIGFWKLFGMKEVTTHSEHGKPACPGATLEAWAKMHGVPAPAFDLSTIEGIQSALAFLGFDPGPIDGSPGPKTREAVRSFQQSAGLGVDGIAGPATKRAITARVRRV